MVGSPISSVHHVNILYHIVLALMHMNKLYNLLGQTDWAWNQSQRIRSVADWVRYGICLLDKNEGWGRQNYFKGDNNSLFPDSGREASIVSVYFTRRGNLLQFLPGGGKFDKWPTIQIPGFSHSFAKWAIMPAWRAGFWVIGPDKAWTELSLAWFEQLKWCKQYNSSNGSL